MQNKIKLIFILSAIVIITAVLFFTGAIKREKLLSNGDNVATSTTERTIEGVTFSGSGNFKVEQVPIDGKSILPKAPNLDRSINFPKDMSSEVRVIIGKKIADNISKLKANSALPEEWLELGINRKMVGDYEGAKEAWEYVTVLNPINPVAFANLSDLYGYFLKDNVQAEKNYLRAIENEPKMANYYLRASDFYREVLGDLSKAKSILLKGASLMPDDPVIKNALEFVNSL